MMSSETLFMLFITSITSLILFFFLFRNKCNTKTRRLPPSPKKLPIIGNLHQLGKFPHQTLRELSKQYGDLMFLQLGSIPTLIVSSSEMAREIIKTHDRIFSSRPDLYATGKITYNRSGITTTPYGNYWREVRKILVLELLTVKRIQSFEQIRTQEMALMMDEIGRSPNDVVDLSELSVSLSSNIVCRVAFGTRSPGRSRRNYKFQEVLHETQSLLGEFNVADYFPWLAWVNKINGLDRRVEETFRDLDEFLDRVIEEHLDSKRGRSDQEDIVDVLLKIQKDPNQPIKLTDDQLKAVLMDVFIAGTDTSSATVIWTMAELMRNPKVRRKAQEEVRQVGKGKPLVEENDISNLTYLKLLIKESLRLHPPAPLLFPRETTENCIIDNKYEIPAKTRVITNAIAIHTDPRHWKNPEKFEPERFLDSQIDFRGQHFELLPFAAGRRGCPGINFAVPLVELALANLLYCFDWEFPKGIKAEDLDMEEALGVTVHKKTPLCLVASPAI